MDEPTPPEPEQAPKIAADVEAEVAPPTAPAAEEHPLAGLARAFKRFLIPFLASWVLAYVGSNLQLEWVYFTGLGGVTVSMLVFLVWLIS
jgi:hypothetical protein